MPLAPRSVADFHRDYRSLLRSLDLDVRRREFILPYEAVRAAARPDEMLLAFFQSTYGAAADLLGWDRSALERSG